MFEAEIVGNLLSFGAGVAKVCYVGYTLLKNKAKQEEDRIRAIFESPKQSFDTDIEDGVLEFPKDIRKEF